MIGFICRFKGHVPEPIRATGLMVISDMGLVMHYVPDPEGSDHGCRRCGLAALDSGQHITPGSSDGNGSSPEIEEAS